MAIEIENYRWITERLHARGVPATFHIVGRIAEALAQLIRKS
jgi:peptidoglycan/xylan/chitin deacetylase (PgdA/CDA1 family)